jgi:diacylglycerol O-acyltransferase
VSRPKALSPLESAFLHIESDRTPMHIASVGIFEGAPLHDDQGLLRLEEIRQRIRHRLDLVPKLRRRVQTSVLPGAPPLWTDDPQFDIARHVEVIDLPSPGTDEQLWEVCAELFTRRLDRKRPLWHMCVVDGLAGERVAVVDRIHHSLADGLAGVEMATVLFDFGGQTNDLSAHTPGATVRRFDNSAPILPGTVQDLSRLGEFGQRWLGRGWNAVFHPIEALRDVTRLGGAITTLVGTGLLRPSTSLNRPISTDRSVVVLRQPLDVLQEAAHAFGVTMNDLVLTAVGGGVARLIEARGERLPTDVHVLVPVGLDPGDRHALGNRVSAWFVRVPVGIAKPVERLHSVSESSGRARAHREELITETVLDLLGPAPQPMMACIGTLANHQPLFNLVVTNVPGPSECLYLLGARMLEAYPFVPLAGNLTLGVAAMSYNGDLTLGVLANPTTCPDVAVFVRGVEADLASLLEATPT